VDLPTGRGSDASGDKVSSNTDMPKVIVDRGSDASGDEVSSKADLSNMTVDGAVHDPSTRGVEKTERPVSTGAAEEGKTQNVDLARRSLGASVPESTSGGGNEQSELTLGRERDHGDHELGTRRVHILGSSDEAKKACKEDLNSSLISKFEDMDELELAVHRAQSTYLFSLEGSVQDAEWSEYLRNSRSVCEHDARVNEACASGSGEGGRRTTSPTGTTTTSSAEFNLGSRVAAAGWTERSRQDALREGLSAEKEMASTSRPHLSAYEPVTDNWESKDRGVDSAQETLEMVKPIGARLWGERHGRSAFTGLGYGTTVTQFEASQAAASRDWKKTERFSGGRLRQLRRELRAVTDKAQ